MLKPIYLPVTPTLATEIHPNPQRNPFLETLDETHNFFFNRNKRKKVDDDDKRKLGAAQKRKKVDHDDGRHNWGEILPEILQLVQSKLSFVDIARSKSVCSSWNDGLQLVPVPWLLLQQSEEPEVERCCSSSPCTNFFCLGDRNSCNLKNMNHPGKCIGSSHGWLVVLDKEDTEASIFHPSSLAQVKLPLFPTLSPYVEWPTSIKPVLSSANPEDGGAAIIMCSEGTELFFCRIGDRLWQKLDGGQFKHYSDIICHNNFLYALTKYESCIEVWDLSKPCPVKYKVIEPSRPKIQTRLSSDLYFTQQYLVRSRGTGNLLLVVRMVGYFVDEQGDAFSDPDLCPNDSNNPLVLPYRTLMFHVYKLDSSEKKWVEVEDLNNEALFLGNNHSVSVSAKDLPPGCGTNVIYFTDDNWLEMMNPDDSYGGHDLGMFSLQNRIIKHFSNKCRPPSEKIWPPPLWVVPNP